MLWRPRGERPDAGNLDPAAGAVAHLAPVDGLPTVPLLGQGAALRRRGWVGSVGSWSGGIREARRCARVPS